jgi:VWFA-related protein
MESKDESDFSVRNIQLLENMQYSKIFQYRMRFVMVRYLWVALLFMCVPGAPAQTKSPATKQDPEEKKVFRVNVDLVQMDVTVTDSDGRHVTDLTAEDFIILQDYKPKEITNFSLVRVEAPIIVRPPVYKSVPQTRDAPPVPAPPPLTYGPDRSRRKIALVVDDLGISWEGMVYVREALGKWVDEEMQPGDLVALIRTGMGVGTLQQFTGDKRMLHAAIERTLYNIHGRVGSSYCSDNTASVTENLMGNLGSIPSGGEHRRHLTLASLGSIQYVLDGLKNLSGRKNLVLFTEDLWMIFDQGMDHTVKDKFRRLVEEANRAAVVIHTIDSRGLVSNAQCSLDDLTYTRDGMIKLAKETGGLFEYDRNDIDGALYEAVRDGDSYYLIGYQPDGKLASEMEAGKQKYHSIQVRVKRPGLHVRTRSNFMGTPERIPEPPTQREQIEQALYSPFGAGTLPVRLTALFSQTREGESRINGLLHFDVNKLTFNEDPEGWKKTEVEIVAALFDIDGQQIEFTDQKVSLTAKGETYRDMMKNGVVLQMGVPAKKAGAYQMRVILSDTESGLMGSATHFVEVPDIRKGRLAVSGIALAAEKSQPGMSGEQDAGLVAGREVNGTTAVRIFTPGETITWAYQVLNAKTGADNKSQLQTYVRLFHEGWEVYAAEPVEIVSEPEGNSGRMIGVGNMQLKRILPGEYALQVVVRDMLANEQHRTVVQAIDFVVQDPKSAETR